MKVTIELSQIEVRAIMLFLKDTEYRTITTKDVKNYINSAIASNLYSKEPMSTYINIVKNEKSN